NEKGENRSGLKGHGGNGANPAVEWFAWALQLAVGFLVGCGIGYEATRLLPQSDFDHRLNVVGAFGLLCGAFTSLYGNRAWVAASIFLAPEPPPPAKARTCSFVIGGVGFLVAVLTMAHDRITTAHSSSSSSNIFLLIAALLPGFLVVHALRT